MTAVAGLGEAEHRNGSVRREHDRPGRRSRSLVREAKQHRGQGEECRRGGVAEPVFPQSPHGLDDDWRHRLVHAAQTLTA
jgi:hypothetical protein